MTSYQIQIRRFFLPSFMLPSQSEICSISLSCSGMKTFSNLKAHLSLALKHLFGCHFKNFRKQKNGILLYYVSLVNLRNSQKEKKKQTNKLEDIDHFDLKFKFYPNCHIRIEMIKLWYCSSLFLSEYYS